MFDLSNNSTFTKYIAAGSPYTPEIVLIRLAEDAEPEIRRRIAENKHSPLDVLSKLTCDDCSDVRIALIDNPSVPKELIEFIARDPNPDVRYALAESPTIPEKILLKLLRDDNPYVAQRAGRTYKNLHPAEIQMFPRLPADEPYPYGRLAT